jgi:peptidoglycan/LPS O-acetylase OafA/YrhL
MGILRLLLALAIVVAHTPEWVPVRFPGNFCVQIFFAISGFYMCFILSKKNSYQNPLRFWLNRFLRLYPSYLFILLFTIAVSVLYLLTGQAQSYTTLNLVHYLQYFEQLSIAQTMLIGFANLTMMFQDLFMFFGINLKDGGFYFTNNYWDTDPMIWQFLLIPQAWSISLEIMFYALSPLLIRLETRWLYFLLWTSFSLRFVLAYHGLNEDPFNYRLLPLEISTFLAGFIACKKIYFCYPKYKLDAAFEFFVINTIPVLWIAYWVGIKTSISLMLTIICSCILPFLFAKTKTSKYDRQLGNLSYPIYINHLIMIPISMTILNSLGANKNFLIFVVLTLSITMALIMIKYIEEPIEKIRQKIAGV